MNKDVRLPELQPEGEPTCLMLKTESWHDGLVECMCLQVLPLRLAPGPLVGLMSQVSGKGEGKAHFLPDRSKSYARICSLVRFKRES